MEYSFIASGKGIWEEQQVNKFDTIIQSQTIQFTASEKSEVIRVIHRI